MSNEGRDKLRESEEHGLKPEQLNIKVTDNGNEVIFKVNRHTKLDKVMNALCDRYGKSPNTLRFLYDGSRIQPTDTPETLEMQDGDTIEVHQEQIGGGVQDKL